MLEAGHILRDPSHRRHDQCPGQFGRGHRRALALGDGNAAFRAGVDVDVRADTAGLRDQLEPRQLFNELARDLGAFANQHKHVRITQADRQLANSLDGIGEDLGGKRFQARGAIEFADHVLIVVEDDNVHAGYCAVMLGCRPLPGFRHHPGEKDSSATRTVRPMRWAVPEQPAGPARRRRRPCDRR